jgi:hypothetical protein
MANSAQIEISELVQLGEEVTSILQDGGTIPEGYTQLVTAKALLSIATSLAAINLHGIGTFEQP